MEGSIPCCSEEDCTSYDGKRCGVMGMRPGRICEPAVEDMAGKLEAAQSVIAEFVVEDVEHDDGCPGDDTCICEHVERINEAMRGYKPRTVVP